MDQLKNAVNRYTQMILSEMEEQEIVCWIAGGSIRDYFMGVPIKTDHDLFFPSSEHYDKCLSYFKEKDCEIVWESENGCKLKYKGRTFDLVKKFFPNPQSTIDEFDFTVSMFAVDKDRVYYGKTSFIDLAKRQLMINKITFPASTLSRAFRYHRKGFFMCQGEIKKIYDSIAKTNTEVREEGEEITSGEMGEFFMGFD